MDERLGAHRLLLLRLAGRDFAEYRRIAPTHLLLWFARQGFVTNTGITEKGREVIAANPLHRATS